MKRGLIVLLLTALPIAPGRAQQPQSAALEDAIVAAWRSNALPPVDYVVSKFAGADWVFLGEYHRIRDDVRLIAELIPALHSRTEVRHLAAEFLRRDRTAAANELITAPTFRRSDAVEFLRSQDPHWPYEEYVELLRAAWESNRVHAAQRGEFRFIGLHPGIDWEAINYGTDPEAVALERRKQDEYDAIMAAELEKHLLVPGQPALIYIGVAHSTAKFTEYRYGTDQPLPRMGNMVYREPWAGRMFFIALHAPFWDAGTGADIYPFDGVLDRAMLSYRAPVGFDTSGAPFDRLGHARRSERAITFYEFGQLYDGYIMHATPLRETVGVTCISDWIVTAEQFRHFWRSMPNRQASERFSAMPLNEFRRDFCAPSADHGLLFRNRFRKLPSLSE
jgi:hypothetical protein